MNRLYHLWWGILVLAGVLGGCQVPLSEDEFHKARDEVTGIALDPNALVLGIDADPTLVGFIEPAGVAHGGTWTSSDTSVATVDSTGVVTPVAVGTSTISAQVTTHEGKVVTKSRAVAIVARVTTVATSSSGATLQGLTQDSNGTLWASRGSYYSNSWDLFGWTASGTTTNLTLKNVPSDYGSSSTSGIPVLASEGFVFARSSGKLYWTTAAGEFTQLHSGATGAAGGSWPYTASATFYGPSGVAVASDGTVYVADKYSHQIRKVSAAGMVTTLAGSGYSGSSDGTGTSASFYYPLGVAVASDGTVYVADTYNHSIRKVTAAGVVTTLAGSGTAGWSEGTGTSAKFNYPQGVAVASDGTVYVADTNNHRIRKVTAAGVVTTLAGSGTPGSSDLTAASASFQYPSGVAVASDGSVYVADTDNHKIRKVTAAGVVTTLAGSGSYGSTDGTGTSANFKYPGGVAVASDGTVYVADSYNDVIRKVTAAGVVTTLAGSGTEGWSDGTGTSAKFYNPLGVAVASDGTVYVGDFNSNRVRKITATGVVITAAGSGSAGSANGAATLAPLSSPTALTKATDGTLYVADDLLDAVVALEPGGSSRLLSGLKYPRGLALDPTGNLLVANSGTYTIVKVTPEGVVTTVAGSGSSGYADGSGSAAGFASLGAVASDSAGNLWVIDGYRVRRVGADGWVTTAAGSSAYSSSSTDGLGDKATFGYLRGIVVGSDGNVYVTDSDKIRKLVVKR